MKINLLLLCFIILCFSLLQGMRVRKGKKKARKHGHKRNYSFLEFRSKEDDDMNHYFDDDLSNEDSYDSTIRVRKPYIDYNTELEYDANDLTEKIREDLRGEDVNYNYE